jgi:RHS repeat-associated protein
VPDQHNGLVKSMTVQPDMPLAEETSTTTYDRNSFGQAIRITSTAVDPLDSTPMTRTQTFGYDDGDGVFPSSATNGMGHTTRMLYHPGLGVLGFEIDPNGVKTRLQYDTFGRPRTRATEGRGPVTFSYHAPAAVDGVSILLTEGASVHVETVGGGAKTAFYNGLGHPYATLTRSTTTAPSVVIASYTGVHDGEVASVSRPFFPSLTQSPAQFIEYDYDTLGRPLDEKLPNGSITKYAYSGVTRVVSDPKGNDTETVFDDLGRIASVSEILAKQQGLTPAQAVETDYGYGPFSDVEEVSISHALRIGQPALTLLRTTHMTYDDLGRRKHLDDPDSGVSDRVYNAFGEIAQAQLGDPSTMPSAQIERIVYTRDQIGRVVAEAPSSQGPNTFQWDTAPFGIGRLASSLSSDGTTRGYSYDSSGRLSQERWTIDQPDPYVVDYRYDDFGRILALFYPTVPGQSGRFAVSYHYDPTGMADAACNAQGKFFLACDPNNAIWRADLRQADGQVTKETFANGEMTDRSYTDPRGFLTKIETTLGAVKNQSLSYTYDLNGNIGTRTEVVPAEGGGAGTVTSETFAYDALNRLATWDQAFQKTTLSYDDIGNFTSRVVTAGTTETSRLDYSFVAGATPHADLVINGTRYSFDGKGRNTRVGSEWNASREITYTPFDLPKQIDVSGGSQRWNFQYDADHQRVQKKDWWRFSVTVGDFYEKNQDWDGLRHLFYIHGSERTVAELEIDPNGKSSFLYVHDDHLGSVHSTTDETGTVKRFSYDIFGARTPSQSRDMRRGFTFQAHDDDITEQASDPGLINMKGRVYDPKIGRFMTADPIVSSPYGSQAYNRYGYVLNNPLSLVDPTGFANEYPGNQPLPTGFTPPTQQEPGATTPTPLPPTTTAGPMTPAPAPVPVPVSPQPGPPGPMPGPITGGPPGGAGAQGPVSDSNGPRQAPMGGQGSSQLPLPSNQLGIAGIDDAVVLAGAALVYVTGTIIVWWHLPSTQTFVKDLKVRMKPKPKEQKVLPQRDRTGKMHDPLPDHVPEDWSPDDMEDVERELEESIKRRAGEQEDLGEDPAHRQKIEEERDFLRRVQKALEDARPKGGT